MMVISNLHRVLQGSTLQLFSRVVVLAAAGVCVCVCVDACVTAAQVVLVASSTRCRTSRS